MFSYPRGNRGERRIETVGIAAASLCEIGPATALSTDLFSHGFDHVAGADAVRVVLGDAGGQANLAVLDRAQHDDGALQLVLEAIDRVAQRLGVGAVHARGQHLDAIDLGDALG